MLVENINLERYDSEKLEDIERNHILRMLEQTKWAIEGKKGAANILGLHPSTLRARMRKLGIAKS
jgi:transcriptional regulator with GAF, ATPase, and Fis domain